ncbi:sigma-70 family RNA polymerase sigma factor, partial [bacterium]|nr:sigma-70 family RNA polymerase sigma factor [bacterium]
MSDWNDLSTFVKDADGEAFARIVRRHVGLVHSAAQRLLKDRAAAEEVTQTVFILLAEKARKLKPTGSLGAWLYQAACLQAKDLRRQEIARQRRECAAAMLESIQNETLEEHWDQIGPILDDAMQTLSAKEREVVILRFFEKRGLREVGETLGLSEDAARKRVARALDRLRGWFKRHQVTCSASVLGGALGTFAVSGVSERLVEATIQQAVSHTPTAAVGALTMTWPLVGAFIASAVLPIALTKVYSATVAPVPARVDQPVESERTGLFAVWDALNAAHGPGAGSMPELYEAISALEDEYRKRALRAVFMTEWASIDPEASLRFFLTAEHGDSFYSLFNESWKTCLRVNPEQAIDVMVANREVFREKIERVIDDIAVRRLSALPMLASFVPQRSPVDTRLLNSYMKAADADLVGTRNTLELLEGDAKREAAAGVAKAWAKKDGPAAWKWAQALVPSEVRGRVLRSLLEGWAMTDPIAALECVKEAPAGGGYDGWGNRGTAFEVMSIAASNHLELALDWYAKSPSFPGVSALSSGLSMLAFDDLDGALSLLQCHPQLLKLMESFNTGLSDNRAARVKAYQDWLTSQSQNEFTWKLRESVMTDAVWCSPDKAMSWINEL